MRKILLFSFSAILLASCSKENQSVESSSKIKKSIPIDDDEVIELVGDFGDEYEEFLSTSTASTSPTIDYEYGVWLLEAALNYHNRGDGETDMYVDNSPSGTSFTSYELPFSPIDNGGEIVLKVSKLDLFQAYEQLLPFVDGKAPFTDLQIVGDDYLGGFLINVEAFAAITATPVVDCSKSIPPGISGYAIVPQVTGSGPCTNWQNASWQHIADALVIENTRYDNKCYLTYQTFAHTVEDLHIGTENRAASLQWKMCKRTMSNGSYVYVNDPLASGQSHKNRLLGGPSFQGTSFPGANADDCLNNADLVFWKGKAQDILDIEDPVLNSTRFFTRVVVNGRTFGPSSIYGHHRMLLKRLRVVPSNRF